MKTRYNIHCGVRVFNPFKWVSPDIIGAKIALLPYINFHIQKGHYHHGIEIGWLNFQIYINFMCYKIYAP